MNAEHARARTEHARSSFVLNGLPTLKKLVLKHLYEAIEGETNRGSFELFILDVKWEDLIAAGTIGGSRLLEIEIMKDLTQNGFDFRKSSGTVGDVIISWSK